MDKGFFRSREFVVAALVAGVLVLGGAYARTAYDGEIASWRKGCSVRLPAGAALAAEPTDGGVEQHGRLARRVVTYELNASHLAGGAAEACTAVGALAVTRSSDDRARVVFTIETDGARSAEAVAGTRVAAVFSASAGGLHLAAWADNRPEMSSWFGDRSGIVDVRVELPDSGRYEIDVATGVGEALVEDLRVGNLTAALDVGDLVVRDVDLAGDLSTAVDVGDTRLELDNVRTGSLEVVSDVGDVQVTLPSRADVGYQLTARTDVGSLTVDVANLTGDRDEDGPSESFSGRSDGFAGRPVKVKVDVVADVGDIRIQSQ